MRQISTSNSNPFQSFPFRCLVEQDPVARKHAAKLKRFSGTYDRYGNRRPPPTIVTTDENGGVLRRGRGAIENGRPAQTPPRRRRKSYKGCSLLWSNPNHSYFLYIKIQYSTTCVNRIAHWKWNRGAQWSAQACAACAALCALCSISCVQSYLLTQCDSNSAKRFCESRARGQR